MLVFRLVSALVFLSLVATPASGQVASPPNQCSLRRAETETSAGFARRCAEDFVKRNGYVADSLKQASLQPAAESVKCDSQACYATFHYADPRLACSLRLVTMTPAFSNVHVEHQDVTYKPGSREAKKCARKRASKN
jgi:hypothetical protein